MQAIINGLSEIQLLTLLEFLAVDIQFPGINIDALFELPDTIYSHIKTLDKLGKCQFLRQVAVELENCVNSTTDTAVHAFAETKSLLLKA